MDGGHCNYSCGVGLLKDDYPNLLYLFLKHVGPTFLVLHIVIKR